MRVFRHLELASPAHSASREPDVVEATPPQPAIINALQGKRTPPRGIEGVPTHSVGHAGERRAHVRARMTLPVSLLRVAGQGGTNTLSLQTRNISASGLLFSAPLLIQPGTPIELEVLLVRRPFGHTFGRGAVYLSAMAHVVRAEDAEQSGWYGLAAVFDDIRYRREDPPVSDFGT
jgi:hypothetical protein